MSYIVTINEVKNDSGILQIVVSYSNGTNTINDTIKLPTGSISTLKAYLRDKVKSLDAIDTIIPSIPIGTFDPSETPVVPTQADIDLQTWLTNYRKLVKAKTTLVDTGVILATNAQYSALLNTVKTTLLASYLDYI